jgi:acetyl-CoA carboxylase carboxyltransferase component
MSLEEKICNLSQRKEHIQGCGGVAAVKSQHAKGKMTARERLNYLFDQGSFHEIGLFVEHAPFSFGESKEIPADGVITGFGMINKRMVFAYAQDFTSFGGSLGKMHAQKICRIMDMAWEAKLPIVGLNDSGGARIQEGVDALSGYGDIFYRNSRNSGRIPQISVVMGPCAGGAAYSPALTDLVIMVDKTSQMFVTGPAVIESVTGEVVDAESLGGAYIHAAVSGNAHLVAENDTQALDMVRNILSYLPSSCEEKPPVLLCEHDADLVESLNQAIPSDNRFPYDMKDIIDQVVDPGSFFELQSLFADNLIIGFARICGKSIGIVANQPISLGGCLDINSADKGARFITLCDAFNIPIVNLVDVPGFMPGVDQEHAGIIRHGAKMLYAYSVAEVPKITVILRKAFGGSYMAMCSKEMGADLVFAWPTAEIAVMGAEGGVRIIYKQELADADDKAALQAELVADYQKKFSNPYFPASRGYIDAVIKPSETRKELFAALELLDKKPHPGRRGNEPL